MPAPRPKRNWAEILTFIVLTLTLLAVICYTKINQDILNATTRPYVAALCQSDLLVLGQKNVDLSYTEGMPLRMGVTLKNFGKLPADAKVWSLITYSTESRESAEPFTGAPLRRMRRAAKRPAGPCGP